MGGCSSKPKTLEYEGSMEPAEKVKVELQDQKGGDDQQSLQNQTKSDEIDEKQVIIEEEEDRYEKQKETEKEDERKMEKKLLEEEMEEEEAEAVAVAQAEKPKEEHEAIALTEKKFASGTDNTTTEESSGILSEGCKKVLEESSFPEENRVSSAQEEKTPEYSAEKEAFLDSNDVIESDSRASPQPEEEIPGYSVKGEESLDSNSTGDSSGLEKVVVESEAVEILLEAAPKEKTPEGHEIVEESKNNLESTSTTEEIMVVEESKKILEAVTDESFVTNRDVDEGYGPGNDESKQKLVSEEECNPSDLQELQCESQIPESAKEYSIDETVEEKMPGVVAESDLVGTAGDKILESGDCISETEQAGKDSIPDSSLQGRPAESVTTCEGTESTVLAEKVRDVRADSISVEEPINEPIQDSPFPTQCNAEPEEPIKESLQDSPLATESNGNPEERSYDGSTTVEHSVHSTSGEYSLKDPGVVQYSIEESGGSDEPIKQSSTGEASIKGSTTSTVEEEEPIKKSGDSPDSLLQSLLPFAEEATKDSVVVSEAVATAQSTTNVEESIKESSSLPLKSNKKSSI